MRLLLKQLISAAVGKLWVTVGIPRQTVSVCAGHLIIGENLSRQ